MCLARHQLQVSGWVMEDREATMLRLGRGPDVESKDGASLHLANTWLAVPGTPWTSGRPSGQGSSFPKAEANLGTIAIVIVTASRALSPPDRSECGA